MLATVQNLRSENKADHQKTAELKKKIVESPPSNSSFKTSAVHRDFLPLRTAIWRLLIKYPNDALITFIYNFSIRLNTRKQFHSSYGRFSTTNF